MEDKDICREEYHSQSLCPMMKFVLFVKKCIANNCIYFNFVDSRSN